MCFSGIAEVERKVQAFSLVSFCIGDRESHFKRCRMLDYTFNCRWRLSLLGQQSLAMLRGLWVA